jgi:hypothetical protein
MQTIYREVRAGFCGIEVLAVLIIIVVLIAVLASSVKPKDAGTQPIASPAQVTGTGKGADDAARAGSAVIRLTRDATADDTAPPAADPGTDVDPTPDPEVGDDILEDIIEGLFGF